MSSSASSFVPSFYSASLQPEKSSKWFPVLALATAWSTHRDEHDKPYYFNLITGLSTYIKPEDNDERPFASRPIGKDSPWMIVYTNKKHYYFYNKSTQWKGWFPPEDLLRKIIWELSEEERNNLLDPRNILPNETEEPDEDLGVNEEEEVEDDEDDEDDEKEEEYSDSEHDEVKSLVIENNVDVDVRDEAQDLR